MLPLLSQNGGNCGENELAALLIYQVLMGDPNTIRDSPMKVKSHIKDIGNLKTSAPST
jgi:hypothetical protein